MSTKKKSGYHIFIWFLRSSTRTFMAVMLAAIVVTICELSIPWMLEIVIDEATSGQVNPDVLNKFGLSMLGIIVLLYLSHHIYLRFEIKMMCQMSFRLYKRMYDHLISQPLSYFKRKKSGELIHRLTNDTSEFETHSYALMSDLPYETLVVIGVIGMMLYLDVTLALMVITFLIVTSILSARIGRPLPTLERRVQILGARFANRLQEILHGIKTVKSYGTEINETRLLDEANQKRVDVKRSSGHVESYLMPVFDLMEILGVVLVVWYGAHLILEESLTVGGLVAFIAYMEILAGPVSRGGVYLRHWREATALAQRISEFLEEGDPHPEAFYEKPDQTIPENTNSVIFDSVCFMYPGSEKLALDNVSFQANKGEIVALVGRNGAGKSTAMELLQRFYSPNTGRVLVGNTDLRAWDQSAWRQKVRVMSQEVFLFNSSVSDNIAYGKNDASDEEIWKAACAAGVDKIVSKLPKGIHSAVGEKGGRLSGGEKQRIALARLFLSDPSVIIYDEPTAAMDGEAAKEIAKTILTLSSGRISLIIAHQAEMVAIADRVILFDDGKIVDSGSHQSLIKNNELYQKLFETIEHKGSFDDLSRELQHSGKTLELAEN